MQDAEVLASLRPAVVVLDAWGRVVQVHGGAGGGLVGHALGDLVGRQVMDLVAPSDLAAVAAVFADGSEGVTQRFHLPFPVHLVGRSGRIEAVEVTTTRIDGAEDGARWLVVLTPRELQPLTQDVMDHYLAGGDALDVAATLAERITGEREEGVAVDAFVLHGPRGGVLTEVTAGDPGSPLGPALCAVVADPAAPWNRRPPVPYRAVAPAELPGSLGAATEAMAESDLRVLADGGAPHLAVIQFGNQPKTLAGSVRLVADRAFDVVAMARARAVSLDALRLAAERDPLTGVGNRARFSALVDQEEAPAPLGILYVDVDRFKAINDGLGHAVGDAVLTEVALRITAACRVHDEVTRIGGDEFAVVLDGADEAMAGELGLRVREAVARPLPAGLGVDQVTVSVGVAVGAGDRRALVRAADLAMLEGKRRGRDVVMSPAGPVAAPAP